ncbi:MAG: hypothetical protein Q8K63_08095 [Acidimicrobiales bacterium]|nr:hypothetical protein [Acidimicrobiales bacterium]
MVDDPTRLHLEVYDTESGLWHPELGEFDLPDGWDVLPAGDAFLTRRMTDQHAKQLEIAAFLAADEEPPDEEPTDDADVFVEIKTARFLSALGLPLPPDLAGI